MVFFLSVFLDRVEKIKGFSLLCQQFWAVLVMRAMYLRRKPFVTIFQVFIPVLFAVFILSVVDFSDEQDPTIDRGSRAFQLTDYGDTTVVYGAMPGASIPGRNRVHLELANAYHNLLQPEHALMDVGKQSADSSNGSTVYNYMVAAAKSDRFTAVYRQVVGSEFVCLPSGHLIVTAFYNYEALHAPVISLNLVDNAILQHYIGTNYSIEITSHPRVMNMGMEERKEKDNAFDPQKIIVTFGAITLVLPVIMASYMTTVVRERGTRTKHMQIMGGMHPMVLWQAMLAFDCTIHVLTVAAMIITFNAYDVKVYVGFTNSFYLSVFLLAFGLAMLPMMYLGAFLFRSPSTGFTVGAMFNFMTGGSCDFRLIHMMIYRAIISSRIPSAAMPPMCKRYLLFFFGL